jgi:hypothetical protein
MIKHIIKTIYDADDSGMSVQPYIEKLLDALLKTNDAFEIREVIPNFDDWVIPTRIQFVMHVKLINISNNEIQDVLRFADFLDLFYEDMSEWSQALRRLANKNEGGSWVKGSASDKLPKN